MANLPVREMVLYKHGVGFFVRQGDVSGEKVALTFRKDEINDVLKSLAVFDQAGGQVLGIHYQTPMDTYARLASSSIKLSQSTSLRDLLRDLRGRDCELLFEVTAGTQELIIGRIIGIDEVQTEEEFNANISILTHNGVQVFPYDTLRSLKIKDEQSSHDLSYFLDTSMSEDDRRVVTVRLSEGEHDLAVYYVAPSPTWRVSYRLVAETDEDSSTGTALLQGWGLFDNRLEEDLDNVRVTLVAGQPISFIYDLYASRIPHRPTIEDESRVAPGPIEYAGGVAMAEAMDIMMQEEVQADIPASLRRRSGAKMRYAASAPPAPAPKMSKSSVQSSTQIQSESKDAGETFQYIVTAPVSVKRGESALVPIIGSEVKYERELLYNGDKLANHPVASLRFDNDTGLTLERGPITVVEDGDYKGEAVIPFTKEQTQVYVPYAVELGVKVVENHSNHNTITGLKFEKNALFEQVYYTQTRTYSIENSTSKSQIVTIEAPVRNSFDLYDTRQPDVETAEYRRWKVSVEARSTVDFVRNERMLRYDRREISSLKYQNLSKYLENKWLDQDTFDNLQEILDSHEIIHSENKNITELEIERQEIYQQQEQIRANLGALQSTGQEANLRNRLLRQLESTQDRLDDIDATISQSKQTIVDTEAKIQTLLDSLV
ncbi:MAG: hypothetical protein Phog2KO_03880 [Phototrophicaceae bacterium]